MKTYNQLIAALSSIASAHLQIKQFGNGDEWELVLNSKTYREYNYPILWAVDVPAEVDERVVKTRFKLIVADIVKRSESNENEVKSDMFQIALDVMAMLYDITQNQGYVWQLVRRSQFIPFTEKYDDYLTGWAFEIELHQFYNWSSCAVPSGTPTGISSNYVTIYDSDGVTVLASINPGGSYTVAARPCDDATVTVNGDAFDTVAPGGTLDVPVVDTDDAAVGSISGSKVVIANSTLNINSTFADSILAEQTQNVNVTYSDSTDVGTISGANVVIPDNRHNVSTPLNTGQTISYAENDDGALERGRLTNFTTLPFNNPFGNKKRFTDSAGGSTYANNEVYDWGCADYKNRIVPVWYRVPNGTNVTWFAAIAGQPYSVNSESWYIPNMAEMNSLLNFGATVHRLNYVPFSGISVDLWTSTTNQRVTTYAFQLSITSTAINSGLGISYALKTALCQFIIIRYESF